MVVVCRTDVPGDHLCLIPADALRDGVSTDDVVALTEREGELVANPSVSPDGRTVVFDRVAAFEDVDLWRIGIDGTDERLLLKRAADGSWSPDGDSIVAVADGGGDPSAEQLVVIDPDGDLGSAVTLGALLTPVDPSYDPDGTMILLAGVVPDASGATGIYTVSGEGPPQLLAGSRGGSDPSWTGDGVVIFVAHPEDGDAFRFQQTDGERVAQVLVSLLRSSTRALT